MRKKTSRTIEWVPLTTLRGVATWATMYQDPEDNIRLHGASTAVARLEVRYLTHCTVVVEGSDTGGNDYATVASVSAFSSVTPTSQTVRLNRLVPLGQTGRLYDFMRYRIAGDGAEWAVMFRVSLTVTG